MSARLGGHEREAPAIRSPRRVLALDLGDGVLAAAVGAHHEQLARVEGDQSPVWRPRRRPLVEAAVGQVAPVRAVGVHDVDLVVDIGCRGESRGRRCGSRRGDQLGSNSGLRRKVSRRRPDPSALALQMPSRRANTVRPCSSASPMGRARRRRCARSEWRRQSRRTRAAGSDRATGCTRMQPRLIACTPGHPRTVPAAPEGPQFSGSAARTVCSVCRGRAGWRARSRRRRRRRGRPSCRGTWCARPRAR